MSDDEVVGVAEADVEWGRRGDFGRFGKNEDVEPWCLRRFENGE